MTAMRGRGNLTLALVIAVFLTLAVAACGGGDSTAPTSNSHTAQSGDAQGGGKKVGGATGDAANDGKTSAPDRSGGQSSGSGEGSGDFVVPGGDNSVQNFGEEASAAEREAASAVLEAYMRARADADRATACANLAKTTIGQLEELTAAMSESKAQGCVAAFVLLDKSSPASARVNTMTGPLGSLRVEGDRAFALYHGAGGIDYVIQMTQEGGWKVAALVPFALS